MVKDVVDPSELDRLKGTSFCLGLHGTSPAAAARIIKNGFDMGRLGNRGAAFGHGIYVTSCPTTSFWYGTDIILVAFQVKPKPKFVPHGHSHGLTTAVISHAKHVLPLAWFS